MISIGGDGTFLHSVRIIRNTMIPIVGINAGRLGFLANVSMQETDRAIEQLLTGACTYEERVLLQLDSDLPIDDGYPCALNEITIQKNDNTLLSIHAWCNDEYLTTYWSDGLIISTPTGSTAYSLSVGGPIVSPECRNFILSPIAPHNLHERPLVLPDSVTLRFRPESRAGSVRISLDSRIVQCAADTGFTVRRADHVLRVIKGNSFFASLRSKLMWGIDKRN